MATPLPAMLPYRDVNNLEIKYAPAPSTLINQYHYSESDGEPLIGSHPQPTELDEDSIMRFTATGRPMPGFKASNLQSMGGDMFSLPQLLPKRYTDDSIIPVIVVDVVPAKKAEMSLEDEAKKRRSSFLGKLKKGKTKDDGKPITKVVYMPRREYLKHFARGLKGEYTGSEPYKQWTEEELEETFKQYKPLPRKKGLGNDNFFIAC